MRVAELEAKERERAEDICLMRKEVEKLLSNPKIEEFRLNMYQVSSDGTETFVGCSIHSPVNFKGSGRSFDDVLPSFNGMSSGVIQFGKIMKIENIKYLPGNKEVKIID